MKAWHFIGEDKKLRYGDGRKVKVGEKLTVDEIQLNPCVYGLHASVNILDALRHAPGTVLCRVELSGRILKEPDKACASERTVVWMKDIRKELILFACDCAERQLDKFEERFPEDKRPRRAVEAAREYAKKGGDIKLVKVAANAAANATAHAAAAANAAAYAAAHAAAYAAAYAAARAAEKEWQRKRLMYYINKAKKCAK